jgi:phosphoribosyl-ATP pyrophosphohydrolase
MQRKEQNEQGSYTAYLFEKGVDKILKKCGEECMEVAIATKNGDKREIINEVSDLLYHLVILLANENISLNEVFGELDARMKKQGNLKEIKETDKDS